MKSIPFLVRRSLPISLEEGDILHTNDGGALKLVKIKSIHSTASGLVEIIGLGTPTSGGKANGSDS